VNSGSSPGAPLGGHKTQVGVPGEPVAVAAPAVFGPPREPPAPPPSVPTPPPPAPLAWPEPLVAVGLPDALEPVEVVDGEVVVPASGRVVVVGELAIVGKATAPPAPG
jgi:hypothetical protein